MVKIVSMLVVRPGITIWAMNKDAVVGKNSIDICRSFGDKTYGQWIRIQTLVKIVSMLGPFFWIFRFSDFLVIVFCFPSFFVLLDKYVGSSLVDRLGIAVQEIRHCPREVVVPRVQSSMDHRRQLTEQSIRDLVDGDP